mgnify:CR=1 FL=1
MHGTEMATTNNHEELAVLPAEMTPEVFKARIEREQQMRTILQDYMKQNMREGYHYSSDLGGVKLAKPMLLQEGSRNICSLLKLFFGEPKIDETFLPDDHYRVRTHIALFNAEGRQITSGDGICSTRETKYAYRKGNRTCPDCGRDDTIIKGRAQYGGGWVCYEKKGGCSAKFDDNDERLTSQQLGRIDNPDKADIENTVLKMSVKRAKAAAVCDVPMVSEIFAPEGDAEPRRDDSTQRPQSSQRSDTTTEKPKQTAPVVPQSVERAVTVSTKLQKEYGVSVEDLVAQFLPEGVGKFSDLSEQQALAILPGLSELMNTKIAEAKAAK